tara:strand:+ start:3606 stop:4190 length:585 start_codon:yes stop_codon:yes gene_type:complete
MIIGYARVSTVDQNLDSQIDALKKAGCDEIYKEKKSGIAEREELQKVLGHLKKGDTLMVTKLDRLGRSLKKLLELIEEFNERGIHFQSLDDGIGTSTSLGVFFFQVVGAFSELERNLNVERTEKGLASARARGRIGGRPLKHSDEKMKHVIKLYVNNEISIPDVNRMYNISTPTFYRRYNEIMKKQEGEKSHVV